MNAVAEHIETNEPGTSVPPGKTPSTRLLDLLHGWGNYVASENGSFPDSLTRAEIANLYQEAGAVSDRDYPDLDAERDTVCRFVTERVLAALLK